MTVTGDLSNDGIYTIALSYVRHGNNIQIPESPNWHFSNGREDRGKEISQEFARKNRKELDDSAWKLADVQDVSIWLKVNFDYPNLYSFTCAISVDITELL